MILPWAADRGEGEPGPQMVRVRQVANVPLAATVIDTAIATTLMILTITATAADDTDTSKCVLVVDQAYNVASLFYSQSTISDFTFTEFFTALLSMYLDHGLDILSTRLFLFGEHAFKC